MVTTVDPSETRFCPECGKVVTPGDRFCIGCGGDLFDGAPEAAPTTPVAVSADDPDRPVAVNPDMPPSPMPTGPAGQVEPRPIDDPDMTRLALPRREDVEGGRPQPPAAKTSGTSEGQQAAVADGAAPLGVPGPQTVPPTAPPIPVGGPPFPIYSPSQPFAAVQRYFRPALGFGAGGLVSLFISIVTYIVGAVAKSHFTDYSYWFYSYRELEQAYGRVHSAGVVSLITALIAGGLGVVALVTSKKHVPSIVVGAICVAGFVVFLILSITLVAFSVTY